MVDNKKIVQNWNFIKAVILDMDGVLVDSEPFHVQSFKIMMDELKLDYDDSIVHSFIGHSIESNIQSINKQFMQGQLWHHLLYMSRLT
ncbi:MAG: HAD hydrolase-like protein [Calditrichaceae bacterium]